MPSIVEAAFAALPPEAWSSRPAVLDTPRERVQRGQCARVGCPRPAHPRARLCAACGAQWRYCATCGLVLPLAAFAPRTWQCAACKVQRRRERRGLSVQEGRARKAAGAARGGAALRARADAEGAEIVRLRDERGWTWDEIARRFDLPSIKAARLRYQRMRRRAKTEEL